MKNQSKNQLIRLASLLLVLLWHGLPLKAAEVTVNSVSGLVNAVNNGADGDIINVAAGTYTLSAPLQPKANMVIKGAGIAATILRPSSSWNPGITEETTDEDGTNLSKINSGAYMITFSSAPSVKISDMTIEGDFKLHGAIYANSSGGGEIANLRVVEFHYAGIRTTGGGGWNIHDNIFVDAGTKPGNVEGAAIYLTWANNSEIWNNHISMSGNHPNSVMGIKFRQIRNSRIHHNTIIIAPKGFGFSMEAAHKNDHNNELDHNKMVGTISIPKNGGGGTLPEGGGYAFRFHHNWLVESYTFEGPRRGVEIDHNLIEPRSSSDNGQRTWTDHSGSNHMNSPSINIHNNLINNPGRAIFWSVGSTYDGFNFHHNEVKATFSVHPHTLFQFQAATNHSTTQIKNNIIDCSGGPARALITSTAASATQIENNALINISDQANYSNPSTGATQGADNLFFTCGYNNEFTVNNWDTYENSPVPSNPVIITAKHSGKVMEVAGGVTTKGANIQQNTYNGGDHQKWNLIEDGSGFYKIENVKSGLVLDVYGQSPDNGANLVQWTEYPQNNQRFSFVDAGGGYVRITPAHSGKCIDVEGGTSSTADGANIFQWAYHGNSNQQWLIEPAFSETTYEAENYTNASGTVPASNHSGYTGSGFADYGGNGTWLEWNNVVGKSSGSLTLKFRYANGSSSNRNCTVQVNGSNIGTVSFAPTGSWTNWNTVSITTTALGSGNNTVRVTASTSNGGPNLDHLNVSASGSGAREANNIQLSQSVKTLDFSVYPNPVINGQLKIEGVLKGATIELYSLTGARLLQQKVRSIEMVQLNVSHYPKGLLQLVIKQNGKMNMHKVMIQ